MGEGKGGGTPIGPGMREAGILLHVSSLPSRFGIGDLGRAAYDWIDTLAQAGQRWWQILPLGPTGHGNSPYEPLSTFAGNPLLLSPDRLVADGLVPAEHCARREIDDRAVDFESVRSFKEGLLSIAWAHHQQSPDSVRSTSFQAFCDKQSHWLDDFCLFLALKEQHNLVSYLNWPVELIRRESAALQQAKHELAHKIDRHRFGQFLFFQQWHELRQYAHAKGVRLIGDLPFFVSPDSSDIWAHPELFLLDANCRPRFVAGVPPDYFSAVGQLWGNPIYDWKAIGRTGFHWWTERLRALLGLVDLIRLDHFRAFESAWHIPAGSATAQTGEWLPGPGAEFFNCLRHELGGLPFVAEDLGMITDGVRELRDRVGLPGMRVLQFAFDGDLQNPFLPQNYIANCLACTGTHDNNTTRGWYEGLDERQRAVVWSLLHTPERPTDEVTWHFLERIWGSSAALVIAPLQDVLNLGSEARMNVPGEATGNWNWRVPAGCSLHEPFRRLLELTVRTVRT